jgi:hypothetical protein
VLPYPLTLRGDVRPKFTFSGEFVHSIRPSCMLVNCAPTSLFTSESPLR